MEFSANRVHQGLGGIDRAIHILKYKFGMTDITYSTVSVAKEVAWFLEVEYPDHYNPKRLIEKFNDLHRDFPTQKRPDGLLAGARRPDTIKNQISLF